MKVVISQPMYFPWVGLFEQVRLCDVFVHYDDVQFTRGFFNRVQAKTTNGPQWVTVPLKNIHRGQLINEILIDDSYDWRDQHREIFRQAYLKSPFRDDVLTILDRVFSQPTTTLAELSKASIMELAHYYELVNSRIFLDSSIISISGKSSQRLCAIAKSMKATTYITGHGARNYLDHELFENAGIRVEYMDYQRRPYPQLHGEFNPYVSLLDLIANTGPQGIEYIVSGTQHWNDFLHHE